MRTTQDRNWQVDGDPFFVDDEQQVAQLLSEAVTILTRVGGAVIIVAQREEVAPDMFHTTGFGVRWESYAPAKRFQEPAGEPAAPEPVPVEA